MGTVAFPWFAFPSHSGSVPPGVYRSSPFESRVFIENWKWVFKGCGSYLIHPGKPLAFPLRVEFLLFVSKSRFFFRQNSKLGFFFQGSEECQTIWWTRLWFSEWTKTLSSSWTLITPGFSGSNKDFQPLVLSSMSLTTSKMMSRWTTNKYIHVSMYSWHTTYTWHTCTWIHTHVHTYIYLYINIHVV